MDFLLAEGKLAINIPVFYFNCCGEFLNDSFENLLIAEKKSPKPKLRLEMSYQDIQNNCFTKNFTVTISAFQQNVNWKFSLEQ